MVDNEVPLGPYFSDQHKRLREDVGERYEEYIREHLEDGIHEFLKQLDRQQERYTQQIEDNAE